MRGQASWLGLGATALGLALGTGASALPIETYDQLVGSAANEVSTVAIIGGTSTCSFGFSCLASPVPISGASVMLDLGTSDLLNMTIAVQGPGSIIMGFNGYEKIVFNNAVFQSSGTATLGGGGAFSIGGAVTASSLDLFFTGNFGATPDAIVLNYTSAPNFNFMSGTIGVAGDQLSVSVNSADLGAFPDPTTGSLSVAEAKLGFVVAVVPEPSAAVLYGVGLLIAGTVLRRRAAVV